MPGIFNVAGGGPEGVSLDEILNGDTPGPAPDLRSGTANVAANSEKDFDSLLKRLLLLNPEMSSPAAHDPALPAEARLYALLNPLSPKERRKIMHKVRRDLVRSDANNKRRRADTERDIEWLRRCENALTEVLEWSRAPLVLQKPPTTKMHQLIDSIRVGTSVYLPGEMAKMTADEKTTWLEALTPASVFIVEHDWAGAFAGAKDFVAGAEIHLPAEVCAFEFQISGRHVIGFASVIDGDWGVCIAILSSYGWVFIGRDDAVRPDPDEGLRSVAQCVAYQIRAISVALEAQVAETEVVRAPHKLNRAREQRGDLPIYDYHVVSLARRSRVAALPSAPGAEPGPRRRLHFRRGHWRHFDNHKTWIKWMLVGDPDLGFVDKHYRL